MGRGRASLMLGAPLLVFLALPVCVLVARTPFHAVVSELASVETRSAIAVSVVTSAISLALTVAMGTPLAYWLSLPRAARARGVAVAEALVDLPTVLPPAVAGVALLFLLGRSGAAGGILDRVGLGVAFTPAAVVLAQVFVAAPYYVRSARAGFEAVAVDVREAAALDGARGVTFAWRVLVPAAAPSLAAGAAMSWSRAIGEFGATVIFAGNLPGSTQTVPLAIYLGLEQGTDRPLILATVMIAISLATLGGLRLLGGRVAR